MTKSNGKALGSSRFSLTDPKISNEGGGVTADQIVSMVLNSSFSRSYYSRQYSNQLDGPRRDVDDECGYPATQAIDPAKLRDMYDREPVAARVVELWPMECWKSNPSVFEDDNSNNVTDFEGAWDELGTKLSANWGFQGDKPKRVSWFHNEEGSPIWDLLRRADVESGVGYYGGILLGLDDGRELSQPAEPKLGRELLFARPFGQDQLRVASVESNRSHPRYGLPTSYEVTLGNPDTYDAIGADVQSANVHWSRIVHLADNCGSDDVYGVPRQRPVWNRLLDLRKIHGGDAEAFWGQVVQQMFFEMDPRIAGDMGGEVEVDMDDIRDAVEKMKTGLQRWMLLKGMKANAVSPQVVDPTAHIDAAVTAICINLGVPKRVFMGSERGELASSQDSKSWNGRVLGRQVGYLTPRLVVPFVDRLIMCGVLPEPKEYTVTWPDEEHLTSTEQAELGFKRTQTITEYVQKGGEQLMTPIDFYTRIVGLTDEEAKTVLDNVNGVDEEERLTGESPPEEEGSEEVPLGGPEPPPNGTEGGGPGNPPPSPKGPEKGEEGTENVTKNDWRSQPRDAQGRFGSGGGGGGSYKSEAKDPKHSCS